MLQVLALLFALQRAKHYKPEPPREYTPVEISEVKATGPKKIEVDGIIDNVTGNDETGFVITICKEEKCITAKLAGDKYSHRAASFQKGFRAILFLHRGGGAWAIVDWATIGGKQ